MLTPYHLTFLSLKIYDNSDEPAADQTVHSGTG